MRTVPFALAVLLCATACAEDPKPKANAPVKVEDLTKLSDAELKAKLTPEQYRICKECGTEPPFRNAYWNNHEAGIYVDVISGKPLFASIHKFDSGSGWPSFWQPLDKKAVTEIPDESLGMVRTEVKAKESGAHLGHVFNDGPKDKTGLRYCINSGALKFIPKDKLDDAGLSEYKKLFAEEKK